MFRTWFVTTFGGSFCGSQLCVDKRSFSTTSPQCGQDVDEWRRTLKVPLSASLSPMDRLALDVLRAGFEVWGVFIPQTWGLVL